MDALEAARRGSLLALLHARGRRNYAKIVVLDQADYRPGGRAPEAVRRQRGLFLCDGQSGELGHLQPIDLLHEEAQRACHLLGKGNSALTALGITAMFDVSKQLRATCFEVLGTEEQPNKARSTLAADVDLESLLQKLEASQWLQPGGADGKRTAAEDFEGNALAPGAEDWPEYGWAGLADYTEAVRQGKWRTKKVQPRKAFTMEKWEHDEAVRKRHAARKGKVCSSGAPFARFASVALGGEPKGCTVCPLIYIRAYSVCLNAVSAS